MILKYFFLLIVAALSGSNTLFDIVYINLESRLDRRMHMEKILNFAKCTFYRQEAVNGVKLMTGSSNISDYTQGLVFKPDLENYYNLDPKLYGMVGCKFSHQIVWQEIIEQNKSKPTLILEDDLDVDSKFVTKVEHAIRTQPDDWEVIILSRCFSRNSDAKVNKENSLVRIGFFYECLAYIVKNADVAKKMQKITLNDPAHIPVDVIVGNASLRSDIIAYAFDKFLACQRRDLFDSDIPSSDPMYHVTLENSLAEAAKAYEIN